MQEKRHDRVVEMRLCFFLGKVGDYNVSFVETRMCRSTLGVCTPVSSADAKPGDLIFFQGTYNTSGASHVGIYVGNGMMIHCGDPISYANINTSYWQQHFYTFGRLP